MTARLIPDPPAGLRERARANGTTRIWWEPTPAARAMGFTVLELDERRLTWSRRQAERMNADVVRAQRAGGRRPVSAGRSVEALAEDYQRSPSFLELKPRTQASYRANIRLIIRKWGSRAAKDFTKQVMYEWYRTLLANTGRHQAVALIRSMSILFSHAELIGWRPEGSNPCYRLKMKTPEPRSRSASWAELDALLAAADKAGLPSVSTAIALSVFQGQRQTDILAARRDAFSTVVTGTQRGKPVTGIAWIFTRSKRGNDGGLYLHPEAAARVRAALARPSPIDQLLTDERTGRAYDVDLFQKRWAEVRAAAAKESPAIAGLQFRDLRRTFGVLSRAGGASKDDAGDVLGNSAAVNPRLGETYMPAQLETASRAVMAIKRPKAKKTA